MYIDKINLKNIRGFEELEFSLERGKGVYAGWTVFTGDNGSGKSTLLKSIAVALAGADKARALQPSFHRWIREGANEAQVELKIVRNKPDDGLSKKGNAPRDQFPANLTFTHEGRETVLSTKKNSAPDRTLWSRDASGWFSCGYGPFRRVFGASPEATRQMVAPTTERFVTMFQEAASLAEMDQWLKDLNYKKLEGKTQELQTLQVVLDILRDDFLPQQITVNSVNSDGLWLKVSDGIELSWHEMSDGYRSALALLSDILRHMINAYGIEDLTDRDENGKLFVKRSGVVLIDEVDAHLHPQWQRDIGFWLKRHFPKVQFLVTSHSPFICQAADSNGLFVLPKPGDVAKPRQLTPEEHTKIISSRSDTILLSPAFGLANTRSDIAVKARNDYADLKNKQRRGMKLTESQQQRMTQVSLFIVDESD